MYRAGKVHILIPAIKYDCVFLFDLELRHQSIGCAGTHYYMSYLA
jgi:hypothetical protein